MYLKKFLLGRTRKIKSKQEISSLFKTGKFWTCSCFVIIYKCNDLQHDRLGVIVSRKIGNAVERNRAKRVFRELFRCNIENNPPFFDLLIKPRPGSDFRDTIVIKEFFNKWQKEAKISSRKPYTP
ncbi:MAG: ribonuclease P protein component [Chitinispirillales bacterium]|nr:ribonuclease P protein component [Chitinispirillales bacterium]